MSETAQKVRTEFAISITPGSEGVEPAIVRLSNGNFVATWMCWNGAPGDKSDAGVAAQIFDPSGTRIGREFLVNSETLSDQVYPSIAPLNGGGFVIVWKDHSGRGGDFSGESIKAQIFDAAGTKIGPEFRANTTTVDRQTEPVVSSLADGGFAIAWRDFSGQGGDQSGSSIKAQVFTATGSKSGPEVLINTQTAGHQSQPAMASLLNGSVVVTWKDESGQGGDASGSSIKGQIVKADGTKLGSEFLMNTEVSGDQEFPALSALPTGGFVAVWQDNSGFGIKGQIYNATRSKVGSEFLVNTEVTGDQLNPSVTSLPNGGFVVAWQDTSGLGGDASESSIKAQAFGPLGNKIGAEFLVNTSADGFQGEPAIASLGNNNFVIGWGSSYSYQVKGQIFSIVPAMYGTNGDDTFTITDGQTAINEAVGAGYDTARASVTYTLPENVEKLLLTTTANINGIGNSGNNDLFGNAGANTLSGLGGDDYLYGRAGNDLLLGGDGSDKLYGEDGNDQLVGGRGSDRLEGGAGADTYVFESVQDSTFVARDKIIGFSGAGGDRIDLTGIDANIDMVGRQAFTFIGSAGFTAAGQLRFYKGVLSGDVDGDGVADFGVELGTSSFNAGFLTNRGPIVATPLSDLTASEDAPFSFTIPDGAFADPDGDVLTYTIQMENGLPLPSWLTFDPQTRTLSGTPSQSDVGQLKIVVTASDGRSAVSEALTLTTQNSNDAPQVANVGQNLGSDIRVDLRTSDRQWQSSVTGLTGGGFVVAWEDVGYSQAVSVRAQLFAADGTKLGSAIFMGSGSDIEPKVASLAGGGFVVVWASFRGDIGVKAQIFDSQGIMIGSELLFNGTSYDSDPSVFGLPDGSFAVTWSDGGMKGQKYSSSGVKIGQEFTIPAGSTEYLWQPQVAALQGGMSVSVWADYQIGGSSLKAQLRGPDGEKIGPEFVIRAPAGGDIEYPLQVSALANGDFVVTWSEYGPDNRALGVKAQVVKVAPHLIQDTVIDEDSGWSYNAADHFYDADGDLLVYTATLAGGAPLPAWLSFDAATGKFTGIPRNADVGSLTLTVTASDPRGASVSDTFVLKIKNTNDAPTGPAQNTVSTTLNTTSGPIVIGVTDPDGDQLSYVIKEGAAPTKGSVQIDQSNGTFVYDPFLNQSGVDSFVIVMIDAWGAQFEQVITVNINGGKPLRRSPEQVETTPSRCPTAMWPSSKRREAATIPFVRRSHTRYRTMLRSWS